MTSNDGVSQYVTTRLGLTEALRAEIALAVTDFDAGGAASLADAILAHLVPLGEERTVTECEPEPAPPLPPGYFARVELPGWRHFTGWFTEGTMGGEPVTVVSDWDGNPVASFKPGPNSLVVRLPTPQRRPEPQRAITSGPPPSWAAEWDSPEDSAYDDDGRGAKSGDFDEREPF